MKLTAEIAYRTIDFVYAETGCKALVCDTNGVIIASVDKDRIGNVHSISCRILQEGLQELSASREDEELSGGMVRVGIHMPIKVGPEVVGTYGIGGESAQVRSIARISVGLIRDDLEKERIRRQMFEQDQRFQTLFASMTEGVALHEMVVDEAGRAINYRIVEVNDGYEKNVGLKKSAVCGKLANDAYGTTTPPFLEKFTAVGLTGVPDSLEVYFEPLNKHFSISIVPWLNRGFATIFFDVSERKRLEQELQRYSSQLEATVEERTQELFAVNEELTAMNEEMSAMNEELTAMNEQLKAMNETLEDSNRALAIEGERRLKKEQELLQREKQYRATISLIKHSSADLNDLLETILHEAISLVGAPGGYIGLLDESSRKNVICHTAGASRILFMSSQSTEEGLLGEVCRSGRIHCVEDYRNYPLRIIETTMIEDLTTVIKMPLKQGEEVKGVLVANWQNEVHPVAVEDLELFEQFGNLASIAMERFHANQKIAKQNLLLQKLAESTTALVNELDIDSVLQTILNQAVSFMGIPHGFIQLFDPDGTQAHFKSCAGRYGKVKGMSMRFDGKGILAEIWQTGRPVIIDDYVQWANRLELGFAGEITAAMQAPLNLDGKTIGSIGLTIFDEPLVIDKEKLAVFDQFATVAAIAVKNAMAHQQTSHQAYHDVLTGLPNRAHLNKRLEREMIRARNGETSGAVLFIDLDDLKEVNDHFGHSSGDSVIIAAGRDIVRTVGEEAFVARVGGDEFTVILAGANDLRKVAEVVNRLIADIRREFEVGGQTIQMSSSIGVTLYPDDGNWAEEILKNADVAMYAAKAAGKNCWRFYEPAMSKDAFEKMVMTNNLRKALENDELSLHYQPLFSMKNKKIAGFEALLRWNSLQHGHVSPNVFIPLAEKSGIILSMGEWVINEAARFARTLCDLGHSDVYVAVNVSPRQLAAEDFVAKICEGITDAGVNPGQIEIEITENVLIESVENSTQKLTELSSQGIRLSLDDFGTGFSSLTYLRNLPVKTLKIDKSFIDRILEDRVQEGFIRSIIDMAHVLSLHVVAEGVETDAQLAKLEQIGCDVVQGYVFSRPVPREEAIRLLT